MNFSVSHGTKHVKLIDIHKYITRQKIKLKTNIQKFKNLYLVEQVKMSLIQTTIVFSVYKLNI